MKLGKIGKINKRANEILKQKYLGMGIDYCEVGGMLQNPNCGHKNALTFAHRHKRIFYRGNPQLLSSYNQTVLACIDCHQILEKSREKTEEVFSVLRGFENE